MKNFMFKVFALILAISLVISTATTVVAVTNNPPVAVDDYYSTNKGTTLNVPIPGVLGNDYDIDGDAIVVDRLNPASSGTMVLFGDGHFHYTPANGFTGVASVRYRISDGNGGEDWAYVYIEVLPLGVGTPGYWKNHPEAWPVAEIDIGGVTYIKDDAIAFMKSPVKRDKSFTMFSALVAAKLNVTIGADVCAGIAEAMNEVDAWMAAYPLGSSIKGKSEAWGLGEPLYWELDEYNNGYLCAPSRDSLDLD
jgi:hypothetical protein